MDGEPQNGYAYDTEVLFKFPETTVQMRELDKLHVAALITDQYGRQTVAHDIPYVIDPEDGCLTWADGAYVFSYRNRTRFGRCVFKRFPSKSYPCASACIPLPALSGVFCVIRTSRRHLPGAAGSASPAFSAPPCTDCGAAQPPHISHDRAWHRLP